MAVAKNQNPVGMLNRLPSVDPMLDLDRLETMQRWADIYAKGGELVPEQFRNEPAKVLIIMNYASRIGADLMMCLQKMFVVKGKPGMEATLAISLLNQSNKIVGRLTYESVGEAKDGKPTDSWGLRAVVTDAHTGQTVRGPAVTYGMVKSEGWMKNPKWQNMPGLMFRYRAAMYLIRTEYPEVIMGMQSKEELEDISTIDGSCVVDGASELDKIASATLPQIEDNGKIEVEPPTDPLEGVAEILDAATTARECDAVMDDRSRLCDDEQREFLYDLIKAAKERIREANKAKKAAAAK